MSVLLMYKQRHKKWNEGQVPQKDAAHIRYIATRPGVMKSTDTDRKRGDDLSAGNGLFGHIKNGAFSKTDKLYDITKYVERLSAQGKNIRRSVLSFTPEGARELGLYRREDWERLIRDHAHTIARGMNIKIQDFEWVAAVHNERGHPHVHVAFWDKRQRVRQDFVNKKIPADIRKQLLKDMFAEQLNDYYEAKSLSEQSLRQEAGDALAVFEEYYIAKMGRDYAMWERLFGHGGTSQTMPAIPCADELSKQYLALCKILPKTGRLSYKLLPSEAKNSMDAFVKELTASVPELQEAIDSYVGSRLDIAEAYISNEDSLLASKDKYTEEAYTKIANLLLRHVKTINSEITHQNILAFTVEQLVLDILRIFRDEDRTDRSVASSHRFGELSKEAKKEYAIKQRDKGIGL